MAEVGAHPFLDKDQGKIRRLFDGIAPRYDLLNHLLSLNLDRVWRRRAIRELEPKRDGVYLDACCGTADLALALTHRLDRLGGGRVIGSDFSIPMLQLGTQKCSGEKAPRLIAGDTLHLPFADETFDGVTVGFGIRNVEDLAGGLAELRRVLRPGGRLVLLEFTEMANPVLRPFVHFYCGVLLPRMGNWISGSKDRAYSYLHESIESWPRGEQLARAMQGAGLSEVRWRALFPGNVALHSGRRQPS